MAVTQDYGTTDGTSPFLKSVWGLQRPDQYAGGMWGGATTTAPTPTPDVGAPSPMTSQPLSYGADNVSQTAAGATTGTEGLATWTPTGPLTAGTTSATGAFTPGTVNNPMDDTYIGQQIAAYAAQHQNDPDFDKSLLTNPAYWIGRIKETGGWQGGNATYWTDKFKTAQFQKLGGGGGGTLPTNLQPVTPTPFTFTPFQTTAFQLPAYTPSAALTNPKLSALIDQLTGIASQSQTVNPNDPSVKPLVDAYRAEQERGSREYLRGQAEQGGPYGNLDTASRLAAETAAQSTGQYQAQVMGQELAARRAQITGALSQLQGLLTAQQQMALQDELSRINTALSAWGTQAGMDQSVWSALQSLGLNQSEFLNQLAAQESQYARSLAEKAYEFDTSSLPTA